MLSIDPFAKKHQSKTAQENMVTLFYGLLFFVWFVVWSEFEIKWKTVDNSDLYRMQQWTFGEGNILNLIFFWLNADHYNIIVNVFLFETIHLSLFT